ncbi:hypothetical protein VAE151_630369 [Vibrio aestuarianus]|uniref:Uncharacterized protein n=1 Tax=Vibrio aestuarianus TaxID=28171 RepID=A0ABN8TN56_9VIBR|nr:hypothetical protein VAE063_1000368 [Vibrio aestuarianus]CAH8223949.1 hypothetical protein VAE128_500364 [Vibrio aestuarianus]CAH8223970.1 hypothetical protein VAE032_320367 [Vibrio aestuarianus]CAH8224483.1 hypothetical protein VAE130_600373 [Vibrio aestuarianus]CAH8235576.1 hypothetical protein VAE151_630369 [Vibrio aestuarianus]
MLIARVFSKKLGVFDKYSSRAQNTLLAIAGNPTFSGVRLRKTHVYSNRCVES